MEKGKRKEEKVMTNINKGAKAIRVRATGICQDGVELTIELNAIIKKDYEIDLPQQTIVSKIKEEIIYFIVNNKFSTNALINIKNLSSLISGGSVEKGTGYKILSIGISDVMLGRNVTAELEIDYAEAKKFVAQADAEQRKADALAAFEEMNALTQEMKARVLAAKAKVIDAIASKLEESKKIGKKEVKNTMQAMSAIGEQLDKEDIALIIGKHDKKENLKV